MKFQSVFLRIIFLSILVFALDSVVPVLGQTVEKNTSVSITIGDVPPPEVGLGPGPIVLPKPGPTKVLFSGLAYPKSSLTFLKDGHVIGTSLADETGAFERQFTVSTGISKYGVWAQDVLGLVSQTSSIIINLPESKLTTIADLFLSPTIKVDRNFVREGTKVNISGYAYPEATLIIFSSIFDFPRKVTPNQNGFWQYTVDTKGLKTGTYPIKVQSQIESTGAVSASSSEAFISVDKFKCAGPDFSFDGRVDIVDFSILVFDWKRAPSNPCVDLNGDNFIDLADFSILMYNWSR